MTEGVFDIHSKMRKEEVKTIKSMCDEMIQHCDQITHNR